MINNFLVFLGEFRRNTHHEKLTDFFIQRHAFVYLVHQHFGERIFIKRIGLLGVHISGNESQ